MQVLCLYIETIVLHCQKGGSYQNELIDCVQCVLDRQSVEHVTRQDRSFTGSGVMKLRSMGFKQSTS